MAFVQIVDMHTHEVRRDQCVGAGVAGRRPRASARFVARSSTRDRNDPNHYVVLAFFDSYESAMTNSDLPETREFGEKQAALLDGPMEFIDLDVIEDRS